MAERQNEILDSAPLVTEEELRLFGSRIVKGRKRKGWKQRELARRTRIEASRLSRLERGVGIAKLEELARLCATLGSSSDELLFGAEPSAEEAPRRPSRELELLDKLHGMVESVRQLLEILSYSCSLKEASHEAPAAGKEQP